MSNKHTKIGYIAEYDVSNIILNNKDKFSMDDVVVITKEYLKDLFNTKKDIIDYITEKLFFLNHEGLLLFDGYYYFPNKAVLNN